MIKWTDPAAEGAWTPHGRALGMPEALWLACWGWPHGGMPKELRGGRLLAVQEDFYLKSLRPVLLPFVGQVYTEELRDALMAAVRLSGVFTWWQSDAERQAAKVAMFSTLYSTNVRQFNNSIQITGGKMVELAKALRQHSINTERLKEIVHDDYVDSVTYAAEYHRDAPPLSRMRRSR